MAVAAVVVYRVGDPEYELTKFPELSEIDTPEKAEVAQVLAGFVMSAT